MRNRNRYGTVNITVDIDGVDYEVTVHLTWELGDEGRDDREHIWVWDVTDAELSEDDAKRFSPDNLERVDDIIADYDFSDEEVPEEEYSC